ncbi:dihydrofolate reductase [Viridothelium virens]|uniref:Dihydrofolate reductase n=1 Tax=Viridothelium virens TaxID=1048519 RepID=A0A6A6GTR9_VIRVR|nr:dihydrofolate reductase [Viridothelium virens]
MPRSLDLTLIVAATPSMGIGRAGTLPWPALKSDMAYFARVTKRTFPASTSSSSVRNAVVMGRKTWESIPVRFRPLKDRINVVLTRNSGAIGEEEKKKEGSDVITATGMEGALEELRKRGEAVGRCFVIGGTSVYEEAMRRPEMKRVLLTRVYKDFECDTFFPADLSSEVAAKEEGWRRGSREDLEAFVGEEVGEGKKADGDVEIEFCLFYRP